MSWLHHCVPKWWIPICQLAMHEPDGLAFHFFLSSKMRKLKPDIEMSFSFSKNISQLCSWVLWEWTSIFLNLWMLETGKKTTIQRSARQLHNLSLIYGSQPWQPIRNNWRAVNKKMPANLPPSYLNGAATSALKTKLIKSSQAKQNTFHMIICSKNR